MLQQTGIGKVLADATRGEDGAYLQAAFEDAEADSIPELRLVWKVTTPDLGARNESIR